MPDGPGSRRIRGPPEPARPQAAATQVATQDQVSQGQKSYCKRCDLTFNNWTEFHNHKVESKRHLVCEICSLDFNSTEGLKEHHKQFHAAAQNLYCSACDVHFSRVGGWTSHLEYGNCKALSKERFEEAIEQKKEWHANYINARNFQDYGRAGHLYNEPHPLAVPMGVDLWGQLRDDEVAAAQIGVYSSQSPDSQALVRIDTDEHEHEQVQNVQTQPNFEGDDLMAFGRVADILESGWNLPAKASPINKDHVNNYPALVSQPVDNTDDLIDLSVTNDGVANQTMNARANAFHKPAGSTLDVNSAAQFPAPAWDRPSVKSANSSTGGPGLAAQNAMPAWDVQPSKSSPVTSGNELSSLKDTKPNAWVANKNLFPKAPAIPTTLAEGMSVLSVVPKADGNLSAYHPDHPDFRPGKYYISFIDKYKCPHRGCTKSIAGLSPFIAHLKSPAHLNKKLQCHLCLNYFGSATALTQHCESQGVRCRARQGESYDAVVDEMTGGTAQLAGTMADFTAKYEVNPQVFNGAGGLQGLLDHHADSKKARDTKFNNFWNGKQPDW